jgi:hypothetical protein
MDRGGAGICARLRACLQNSEDREHGPKHAHR